MTTIKSSILSFFWLILLTLLSVYVGEVLENRSISIFVVLFIVFLKGQQIIDIFMELKHAPSRWRFLLMSYVIIIPVAITAIYLF